MGLRASIGLLLVLLALTTGCQSFPASMPPLMPDNALLVTVADSTTSPVLQRGWHRDGYTLSHHARRTLQQLEQDYALRRIDGWPIRVLGVYCAVMLVDSTADRQATLVRLQQDSRVRLAQPLQTFAVQAALYNDPYFAVQYADQAASIEALHRRVTGRGISIAIIDTGIDRQHPDLRDSLILSRNFVSQDTQFDRDIHGTALAGVIVSHPNNHIGIVGLAPDARLLALKACWQQQEHDISALCNSFTLAKALTFAIEQRADIINFSLAGPTDPLLSQLLQRALAGGAIVVAARNSAASFPASEPGVIAVSLEDVAVEGAGTDPELLRARADILSTSPGGHYDFFHGVSLLTAQVSALTALLKQQAPEQRLTPALQQDLRHLLQPDLAAVDHD